MAKRYRGHFCWCCQRVRSNESFSGRGHAHHLCRECGRLPKEERDFRQAARDIDRCLRPSDMIRKNQRPSIERFLSHPNERVRRFAAEVIERDAQVRAEVRELRAAGEATFPESPDEELFDDGDITVFDGSYDDDVNCPF